MNDSANSGDSVRGGSGRCCCGGTKYRVREGLRDVVNCHCERCRRITGHFMAASGCELSVFEMVDDGTLRWYEPAEGVFYGFCETCGSTLFWKTDAKPGWISICAGTLDQPTGLKTTAALWTAELADYHSPQPGLQDHISDAP